MGALTKHKHYLLIFVWLTVLTAIEVAITEVGLGKGTVVSGLIGLALAKAALVAYYYMHLNHETMLMRKAVVYCFTIPVVYAIVLIIEGAWRML